MNPNVYTDGYRVKNEVITDVDVDRLEARGSATENVLRPEPPKYLTTGRGPIMRRATPVVLILVRRTHGLRFSGRIENQFETELSLCFKILLMQSLSNF